MIEIVHTILTDTSAREADQVQARLSENTSAGIPWFDGK